MHAQFYNYGKRVFLGAMVIFTMLVLPGGVFAQGGPSDPEEMESFFDGIMLSHLAIDHIPGATLVVVKDGEIFFSKGYGHADVERAIAVDPARTLFRIGVGQQAVHLDGGDAIGGAGRLGPGRRCEQLPRF